MQPWFLLNNSNTWFWAINGASVGNGVQVAVGVKVLVPGIVGEGTGVGVADGINVSVMVGVSVKFAVGVVLSTVGETLARSTVGLMDWVGVIKGGAGGRQPDRSMEMKITTPKRCTLLALLLIFRTFYGWAPAPAFSSLGSAPSIAPIWDFHMRCPTLRIRLTLQGIDDLTYHSEHGLAALQRGIAVTVRPGGAYLAA